MKLSYTYDHHNALSEWEKRDEYEWLTDVFEKPSIQIRPKCTDSIRTYVAQEFADDGWALDVPLDHSSQINVTAMKADMGFQLQTGNISRAGYDLLKLQYLFQSGRIDVAALAVPTKEGAKKIGSNIANADRIANELKLFSRIVTVPILLVAFE